MKPAWTIPLVLLLAASCGGADGSPADVADAPDVPADAADVADAPDASAPDPGPGDTPAADAPAPDGAVPVMVKVPAGTFEMGDHSGLGGEDPKHPSDELPLHAVTLSAFEIGRTEVTCGQYAAFLNAARAAGTLTVAGGMVTGAAGGAPWFATVEADPASRIALAGERFEVQAGREDHPVTGVRWEGAAAYANWLSELDGLAPCIDLATGTTDLAASCYRLPTEAEWEYAALGGRTSAYPVYPWGDDLDATRANWPSSGDPWEAGPDPKTTPVGFFDGSLRSKKDFGWPDARENWQTGDGSNGFGLYDMAGNVWEWTNDWYRKDYYAASPAKDPPGPALAEASPMPDGKPYRVMRGGNWFNGTTTERPDGHSRVSNRDPSYFRGPGDPDGPWFHVGFRPVRAR